MAYNSLNKKTIKEQLNNLGYEDISINDDFIFEIIESYLFESNKKIELLESYEQEKNILTLKKIIHNFKSTSGYVGAVKLQELLKELEINLKEEYIEQGIVSKKINEIKREFTNVEEELVDFLMNNRPIK